MKGINFFASIVLQNRRQSRNLELRETLDFKSEHMSHTEQDMSMIDFWLKRMHLLDDEVETCGDKATEVYIAIVFALKGGKAKESEVHEMHYTFLQFHENTTRLLDDVACILENELNDEVDAVISKEASRYLWDVSVKMTCIESKMEEFKSALETKIQNSYPSSE